jgi:MOSC domain-containing protein YiiM
MPLVLSVNVGRARPSRHTSVGVTGIDKQPVDGPVEVRAPGPRRGGLGSGLAGDAVCDHRHHGGDDQAVYAYAREDLDRWVETLGRPLANGCFGENLTTAGLDVTGASIGERWRIGSAMLEVAAPRIPCRTFAGWLEEAGWIKRFIAAGRPGAYLRVVEPGAIQGGDTVTVIGRPEHGVTIELSFRALTIEPALLPRLVDVEALPDEIRRLARRRVTIEVDADETD